VWRLVNTLDELAVTLADTAAAGQRYAVCPVLSYSDVKDHALEAPAVFGDGLREIDFQRANGFEGFADSGTVLIARRW
jgi:hypothetical protein